MPSATPEPQRGHEREHADRPTVYYDGTCGVCTNAATFIRARDRHNRFRLVPLQTEEARQRLAPHGVDTQDPSTMAFAQTGPEGKDRVWTGSNAALRVARGLGVPWSALWVFVLVPRPIRDAIYGWIARNRHRLGGSPSTCPLPITDNTGEKAS